MDPLDEPNSPILRELISQPLLDQIAVMDMAAKVVGPDRVADLSWVRRQLSHEGSQEIRPHSPRASQIAASWMPECLDLILFGLSQDDETRFSILCSLTDVPQRVLRNCAEILIPAILEAALGGNDPEESVDYMAGRVLSMLPRRKVQQSLTAERMAQAKSTLLDELGQRSV